MMELGGGINLENFEVVEPGKLIVVKKVVGNYTKTISEKIKGFKKITVKLDKKDDFEISVKVEAEKTIETASKNKNLFFALDEALSQVLGKTG